MSLVEHMTSRFHLSLCAIFRKAKEPRERICRLARSPSVLAFDGFFVYASQMAIHLICNFLKVLQKQDKEKAGENSVVCNQRV